MVNDGHTCYELGVLVPLFGAESEQAMTNATDKIFSGSIAKVYETHLVPLIFEAFAADLVQRVARRPLDRLLEVAAGTGVVTRRLAEVLPTSVQIVATDLNQAMLDEAVSKMGARRSVEWRQADAMNLPFPDAAFDAVVCQFGAMFFPDKPRAFAEARRVLRPGGLFLFNVWDRLADNEFADTVTTALKGVFPDDPPTFMARIPHGYHDAAVIASDLGAAGFRAPEIVTVTARSRATSPRIPAIAYCQGTPMRNEIETRDVGRLIEATDVVEAALARRFGHGEIEGKIQALVVAVER
jgi:SAM-dependent methyltransferase